VTLRPWIALGVDLRFLATEEGGRSKPLASEPYLPLQYRPNWRLPGMSDREQAGAPVLCFGTFPVGPGDATAAVIVPLAMREPFDSLSVGERINMHEGLRVVGRAQVIWIEPTTTPVPDEDAARFHAWARGRQVGHRPDGPAR